MMRISIIVFYFLLLPFSNIWGQDQTELKKLIEEKINRLDYVDENERYDSLSVIADAMTSVDTTFEKEQLERLVDITSKYKNQRAYLYSLMAYSNYDRTNAVDNLNKAYRIADKNGYKLLKAKVLTIKGRYFREYSMYDSLTITLVEATKLLEESGFEEEKVSLLHNSADLYYSVGIMDKAQQLYLEILQKKGNEKEWNIWRHKVILDNLALIQMDKLDYRKALEYLEESLQLNYSEGINPRTSISIAFIAQLMARCYYYLNDTESAIKYYNISYPICYSQKMYKELLHLYNLKAEMNLASNNADSSITYCLKGKELVDNEAVSAEGILKNYNLFSEVFKKTGNYENAYYYKNKFSMMSDSIQNDFHTAELMQYLAEDQYNRVANNLMFAKRKNTYLTSIIVITIVFVIIATVFYFKLRSAHKSLLERDREKTEMMGVVTHNLKNPIGAIQNAVSMIKECPDDNALISEMSNVIDGASKHMLESVTQLLFSSKLEDSLFTLDNSEFNLLEAIDAVINENEVLFKNKNQNIIKHYPAADKIMVIADYSKITAAIDNYISNAIKYSPYNSTITVKVNLRTDDVYFSVIDEGPGLSSKEIELAFGKFIRLSPQPTGDENSTGLGLSIVKKIIELHFGKTGIISKLQHGSEFYFTLPIRTP